MRTVLIRKGASALILSGVLMGGPPADRAAERKSAGQTTEIARDLVLRRINAIARQASCREAFGQQRIDLQLLRRTTHDTRFYAAVGLEGNLPFSAAVGTGASPDQSLRELAREVSADAFVLGYRDGGRYVRTKRVVLNDGYFEQEGAGALRQTTVDEKQNLLLHEILHIALNKDDDDLNARELCPLRLLAFCPPDQGTGSGQ